MAYNNRSQILRVFAGVCPYGSIFTHFYNLRRCTLAARNVYSLEVELNSKEAEKLGTDKAEVGVVAYSIRD